MEVGRRLGRGGKHIQLVSQPIRLFLAGYDHPRIPPYLQTMHAVRFVRSLGRQLAVITLHSHYCKKNGCTPATHAQKGFLPPFEYAKGRPGCHKQVSLFHGAGTVAVRLENHI